LNYIKRIALSISTLLNLFLVLSYIAGIWTCFSISLWEISPKVNVLFLISAISFLLSMVGFNKKDSIIFMVSRVFSGALLCLLVCFVAYFPPVGKDLIKTSYSPDHHYSVKIYRVDGGATIDYAIQGEISGPLWFKKIVFNDYKVDYAKIYWQNNTTISINSHKINLEKGESYDFRVDPDWKDVEH
jgi:hypothetical protein